MNWTSLLSPGGKLHDFIINGTPDQKQKAIESLTQIATFIDKYNDLLPDQKQAVEGILLGRHTPITSAVKVAKAKPSKLADLFKTNLTLATRSHTLPILECVLIRKDGYAVTSDLEKTTGVKLPNYSGEDDVLVPGFLLKGMKPEEILGSTVDKGTLNAVLKTTKGDIKFASHHSNEYPAIEEMEKFEEATFTPDMVEKIKDLVPYCGNDDPRPVMSGVYVNNKNIVATDAHLLKWYDVNTDVKEGGIIIPSHAVKYLIPGQAKVSNKTLNIIGEDSFVIINLTEGKYPNWEAVTPKTNPLRITLDRAQLITNLEMLLKITNKTTHQVRINTITGKMSAEDLDYNNEMTLDLPTVSKEDKSGHGWIEIGFNGKFLLQATKKSKDANVTIDMSEPNRAGIIDGHILVMPILLN